MGDSEAGVDASLSSSRGFGAGSAFSVFFREAVALATVTGAVGAVLRGSGGDEGSELGCRLTMRRDVMFGSRGGNGLCMRRGCGGELSISGEKLSRLSRLWFGRNRFLDEVVDIL